MHRLIFASIASFAITILPTTAAADRNTDALTKQLQGVWDLVEGVNQGEELSNAELQGTTMVIQDNAIITYDKDKKEK